jgi:hypothetical protein
VSLSPPSYDDARQAAEWTIDMNELEASISPRTKMLVSVSTWAESRRETLRVHRKDYIG